MHLNPSSYLVILLLFNTRQLSALVTEGELPHELLSCYNRYSRVSLRDVVGQSVSWSCEAPVIRRLRTDQAQPPPSPSAVAYITRLLDTLTVRLYGDFRYEHDWKCVRREYRMLSDQDRDRFHAAINRLKYDTTVLPNKYDAIANLHSGEVIMADHGGPTFLGWHRVYLLLMELALQEADPGMCLPYWDSSLDSELEDPSSSYMFSPDFIGGGRHNASVPDGPFADWIIPFFGPLIRNIGANGQLYSVTSISKILKQTRTRDVSLPTALPQNSIEFYHNAVHVFIGGQMNILQSAAHDPVFFLHHSYVDYLWEAFRDKQRSIGIDPQFDYPQDYGLPIHGPNRPIKFGNYSMRTTAKDSYSNIIMKSYKYEPSPVCSEYRPNCGSKYLACKVETGRCIPVDPANPSLALSGYGRSCTSSRLKPPVGIQNTFCMNGICDMKEWVYMPVKVVSMRSPDLETYDSFPVYNGSIDSSDDIYQPSAYAETKDYIPRRPLMKYEKCGHSKGMGQIFIQTTGLSYDGVYKESVIIDQRLATSIAIGYVAVKDPKNGPVLSLVRAFDSCGRICNTAFKELGSSSFKPSSGVVHIADVPGYPKQFGKTYGQATLNTWGYSRNEECPNFVDDNIAITFYCDYNDRIPWLSLKHRPQQHLLQGRPQHEFAQLGQGSGSQAHQSPGQFNHFPSGSRPEQNQLRQRSRDRLLQNQQVEARRNPISGRRRPLNDGPGSSVHRIPSEGLQHPQSYRCQLAPHCYVNCDVAKQPCSRKQHQCLESCNTYAVCVDGRYQVKTCPYNWGFDSRSGRCTPHHRCSRHRPSSNQPQQIYTKEVYGAEAVVYTYEN